MIVRVTRSRTLPITKFGCSRAGSSKTAIRASRRAESQPSPEYRTPTRPIRPTVPAAFSMSSSWIWLSPSPMMPGNISPIDVTSVSWASGYTLETQPTTKKASASTGKTERKPK